MTCHACMGFFSALQPPVTMAVDLVHVEWCSSFSIIYYFQNNQLLQDACREGVDTSILELLLSESPSSCDVNGRDKVSTLVLLWLNIYSSMAIHVHNGLCLFSQHGRTCLHTICASFPKVLLIFIIIVPVHKYTFLYTLLLHRAKMQPPVSGQKNS